MRSRFIPPNPSHPPTPTGGEGTYDNRGGLDYHIPVEGGVGARPAPLHIVHVAVEMAPIAKVGLGGGCFGGVLGEVGGGVSGREGANTPDKCNSPPALLHYWQQRIRFCTHSCHQVGGLGDVVTSLGRAVQDQGHHCEVILPW